MRAIWIGAAAALVMASSSWAAPRPLAVADMFKEQTVSAPALSPDGAWVAYQVKHLEKAADKGVIHLWMTSWDGARTVQLTSTPKESETKPRWSPDGRYLAFVSSRGDEDEADQLWLLDRTGGEAMKLTQGKLSVEDYAWSPDGQHIALILRDPEPEPAKEEGVDEDKKRPQPIVIDRFQFKQDIDGYLGARRGRLYVMDLTDKKPVRVTADGYEEALPSWSPDGKRLAFVSKGAKDYDRDDNWDVYVAEAKGKGAVKAVTTFAGIDNMPDWESYPAWSPDGKSIAYLQGGPPNLIGYGVRHLTVVSADGGTPRVVTGALDRNVSSPQWTADGRHIRILIEDDGVERLAEVPAAGGAPTPLLSGRQVVLDYDGDGRDRQAVLVSDPTHPPEVFALSGGKLRPLSHQNDWLNDVVLAGVEETHFKSRDGTEVHGFLTKPSGFKAGRKYPTILRLHGGPQSQYNLRWSQEWQMLAAQGYVVVASNPRGSNGRGKDFGAALYADWGGRAVEDVLASVDDAVAKGIVDPDRLGVGGWSYGGILTNFVIAQDTRFKVAASGASISNVLAGYGTDQYIRDYEVELGKPWEKLDAWMKFSYPFYHADKIKTPTLFLGGEKDFNVPVLNSEQMYQALKSQGVDSQLIIYPGQYHGLTRPSFLKDRMDRYVAWYGKYLKP
ncbi:S9 family peptidase [soil metagenome]